MRNFSRNILLILSLILCLTLTLVACTQNNPPDTTDTSPDSTSDTQSVTENPNVTEPATEFVTEVETEEETVDNTIHVTFDYGDGRALEQLSLMKGDTVAESEAPTRVGYDFGGWYADADHRVAAVFGIVETDCTYYATWLPHTAVRITFDSRGGTAVDAIIAQKGSNLCAPADPTKDGYMFAGWYTDSALTNAFDFSVFAAETATLYAAWTPAEGYAEVIGLINGEEVSRTLVRCGETFEAPIPDEDIIYSWFSDATLTCPYDFDQGTTNRELVLYGVAMTQGLVIEEGVVLSYTGSATNVVVPSVHEGHVVTTIGDESFRNQSNLRKVDLPDSITTVGNNAFENCPKLVSVNLTAACTYLGEYAFYGCTRLETVGNTTSLTAIPDGAFLKCANIQEVALSEQMTTIGDYAFGGCAQLRTLSLSDSITKIGIYAFSDCDGLLELHLPESLTYLGTGAFSGCASLTSLNGGNTVYRIIDDNLYGDRGKTLILYVPGDKGETVFRLPRGVVTIATNAFYGNKTLRELDLPSNEVEIQMGAFAGMEVLEELTLYTLPADVSLAWYFGAESGVQNGSVGAFTPDTLHSVHFEKQLTDLADYAFYGCSSLHTITGIEQLLTIGDYAFSYTALEVVNIPASLTQIGEGAFYGCSSLISFVVDAGNENYASYDDCLYDKALSRLYLVPQQKTEVAFAPAVKVIETGAFYRSEVTEIVIPETVEEIEFAAFSHANSLTKLTVPFIGGSANENTYMIYIFGGTITEKEDDEGNVTYRTDNTGAAPLSLNTLVLTGNITKVPDFAFTYLSHVTDIQFEGEITEIGIYAFYNTGLAEMVIPNTVTSIGEYAFSHMDELKSITIPGSVGENLGMGILSYNTKLETVTFEEGVKLIPYGACYPVAQTSTTTGATTYSSALKTVRLPSTLEKIDDFAFAYAGTNTTSGVVEYGDLTLEWAYGEGLTEIGECAFYFSSVKEVTLPASLREVKILAFGYCVKLEKVTFGTPELGSSLENVGGACFCYCTSLRSFTVYKNVESVEDVPVLEQFETSDGGYKFNIFYGGNVPAIYVYGVEFYCTDIWWQAYEDSILEISE